MILQKGTEAPGTGEYDVSRDGKRLAFVADSRPEGVYPDRDVFLMDIGAKEAKNITADNEAPDGSPMFAPDGRTLAYTRQAIPGFYGDQRTGCLPPKTRQQRNTVSLGATSMDANLTGAPAPALTLMS